MQIMQKNLLNRLRQFGLNKRCGIDLEGEPLPISSKHTTGTNWRHLCALDGVMDMS